MLASALASALASQQRPHKRQAQGGKDDGGDVRRVKAWYKPTRPAPSSAPSPTRNSELHDYFGLDKPTMSKYVSDLASWATLLHQGKDNYTEGACAEGASAENQELC